MEGGPDLPLASPTVHGPEQCLPLRPPFFFLLLHNATFLVLNSHKRNRRNTALRLSPEVLRSRLKFSQPLPVDLGGAHLSTPQALRL